MLAETIQYCCLLATLDLASSLFACFVCLMMFAAIVKTKCWLWTTGPCLRDRFYLLHGAIDAPLPEHARQLFMVPEFRKGVLDFRDSETPSEDSLMWQLQNMFSHLQVWYCTVGIDEQVLVSSLDSAIGVNDSHLQV